MATTYGGWCGGDDYQARLDYSTSATNTAVTISATTKLHSGGGGYASNWPSSWNTKVGSSTSSGSGNLSFGSNATTGTLSSKTLTVNKTHAAQSVSVSAYVNSYCGSSTASATVSVPALASYTVSYNMNGGSGTIANQTKWYGESLTLSSTVPTRTNYAFKGWATSQANANNGTVTYQKGATYTGNAALTLFAVWELTYVAPKISSLSVFRSDSSGNRDDESDTALTFKCSWSLDQTGSPSGNPNDSGSIKFSYNGTSVTVDISGQSGTTTKTVTGTFDGSKAFPVTALLTDEHGLTASNTATVSSVFRPMMFRNKGYAAALFGMANPSDSRRLRVFGNINTEAHSYNAQTNALTSASTNVSATASGTGLYLLDSAYQWVSRIIPRFTSSGEFLMLETHRKLSNTDKYHELFIGMDANCKPKVVVSSSESNPSAKAAWFTAIGAWTQLTSAKSGTTMSFTIPTGCSEIMVAAVCTSTLTVSGASVRRYAGSVVVPFNRLDTTQTEWLLGGGSVGSTSSASGTRYCAVRLTKTSALGIGAHCDGTDYASSTTFYVYWR